MSLNINTLYNLSCIDGMKLLPENFIDLSVTSPPYNVGMEYDSYDDKQDYDKYLLFSHNWLKELFKITKEDGRLCLNVPIDTRKREWSEEVSNIYSDIITIAKKIGWKYQNTIIWQKESSRTWGYSWCSARSPNLTLSKDVILILYKNKWFKSSGSKVSTLSEDEYTKYTDVMWNIPPDKNTEHPAPFPIEIPIRCIKLFSYIEDIILDPFVGSGTTAEAAIITKRNYIGFDLSKKYINMSNQRIKTLPNSSKQSLTISNIYDVKYSINIDKELKLILDIINKENKPLKAKEIEKLGGKELKEAIYNSRKEKGTDENREDIYWREIRRCCFRLCAEGLIKDVDDKKYGQDGTFMTLHKEYISSIKNFPDKDILKKYQKPEIDIDILA